MKKTTTFFEQISQKNDLISTIFFLDVFGLGCTIVHFQVVYELLKIPKKYDPGPLFGVLSWFINLE